MNTILLISSLIYILVLAYLSGLSESMHWAYKYNKGQTLELPPIEHNLWTVIRFVYYSPVLAVWFYLYNYDVLFGAIALTLFFIFIHDGAYYQFRNEWDGSYPKGFRDTSHSSTATTPTFDWNARIAALIVGSIFLIAMVFGENLIQNTLNL